MKLIFFGTSEFAVPALKKLVESGYDIAAVITQPDKPAGRKQELLLSPVKAFADKNNLPVYQPESLSIIDNRLPIRDSDIAIVASYGKIIPAQILELPKHGALNIHPSLLPKYRGPSPIQAAILNGDEEIGVTIIKLDEKIDHGDIVAQDRIENLESRIKYGKIHDKLAVIGAELLIKILPDYVAGKIKPRPQDHSKATYAKIITKDDARIDWRKSAEEIDRMIRAYSEWPVAWTMLEGKRLKIFQSSPAPNLPHQGGGISSEFPPLDGKGKGGVIMNANVRISVNTGSGQLELLSLQLEGGKKMSVKDFINGYPRLKGEILI